MDPHCTYLEDETMTEVIESKDADSRLERVRKMLAKAQLLSEKENPSKEELAEAEMFNVRAAELIAAYGIDRAMLAADGKQGDRVVDKVFIVGKPFSLKMRDLLWSIAFPLRGKGRYIKRFNPDLHGGRRKGGWEHGLRLFAYESDMARIEMLYASLRNQALSGASRIVDDSSKFGQRQKAERESYLDGFTSAVWQRIDRAEKEAIKAKEAERQEEIDRLMLEGGLTAPPTSVALVLVDRTKSVEIAMDKAYGITPADRVRWEADAVKQREARKREMAACPRCSKGRACTVHGTAVGRLRTHQKVGSQWHAGYEDGQSAILGNEENELESKLRELNAAEEEE